ncbi:MAG: hypothetical protein AAFV59_00155 [Pseudomonadota bacterium]
MLAAQQALFGLIMIAIGSLKTWLHINAATVLALPTCNGRILELSLNNPSGLTQLHCWGCYLALAGLSVLGLAIHRFVRKRRSVASWVD